LPFLIGPAAAALWAHNAMIGQAESVEAAWAQVESNLQRRADLVPRLVEVVKRAMSHESEVLEDVARQRAAPLMAVQGALEKLSRAQTASRQEIESLAGATPTDAASLASLVRRDAEVARGVQVVLAVAESYPSLRSSDQLLELQAQLEGSENRINAARMAFNAAVRDYNAALAQLPTSLVARAQGLERRPYFNASEGAHIATSLGLE
jgi:LemA protein